MPTTRTRAQSSGTDTLPDTLPDNFPLNFLLAVFFRQGASAARAGVPRTGRPVQANSTILACAVEIGQCALGKIALLVRKFRRTWREHHHEASFRRSAVPVRNHRRRPREACA